MDITAVVNAVTVVLGGVGAFFFLIGTLGVLRFPDFYSRTHASTKCDTVGACGILLALAVYQGLDFTSLKIVAIAAVVLLASPTAGHALARAAYRTGLQPWTLATAGRTDTVDPSPAGPWEAAASSAPDGVSEPVEEAT